MDDPILNVARPLYFETGHGDWPYIGAGTCFSGNYHGRFYLVTALHVLENLGAEPKTIFVLPTDQSPQCIPISNYFKVKGPKTDDSDYRDLAVFRINEPGFQDRSDKTLNSFKLDSFTVCPNELDLDAPLWFFGYPNEEREVDYDSKTLAHTRIMFSAQSRGAAISMHCYEMTFQATNGITDMNGFSGSPVFHPLRKQNGKIGLRFAGLVIRAGITGEKGVATFIGSEVLIQLLNTVEAELNCAT